MKTMLKRLTALLKRFWHRNEPANDPYHPFCLPLHVDEWNKLRKKHSGLRPDLRGFDLRGFKFPQLESRRFQMFYHDRNPKKKTIFQDILQNEMDNIDLHNANMQKCALWTCTMKGADLRRADLYGAEIRWTDLSGADLRGADLRFAEFSDVDFTNARFEGAAFGRTRFNSTKFTGATGLDDIFHHTKNTMDIYSIISSRPLPKNFINQFFNVQGDFAAALDHIDDRKYSSCFISYAHKDSEFVHSFWKELIKSGVPCWFDRQDMKSFVGSSEESGEDLKRQLFSSVLSADLMIIVLSLNSISSMWVAQEIEARRMNQENSIIPIIIHNMERNDENRSCDTRYTEIIKTPEWHKTPRKKYTAEWLNTALESCDIDFRDCSDERDIRNRLPKLLARLRRRRTR